MVPELQQDRVGPKVLMRVFQRGPCITMALQELRVAFLLRVYEGSVGVKESLLRGVLRVWVVLIHTRVPELQQDQPEHSDELRASGYSLEG